MTQLFNIDIQKEDQKQISWNRKNLFAVQKTPCLPAGASQKERYPFLIFSHGYFKTTFIIILSMFELKQNFFYFNRSLPAYRQFHITRHLFSYNRTDSSFLVCKRQDRDREILTYFRSVPFDQRHELIPADPFIAVPGSDQCRSMEGSVPVSYTHLIYSVRGHIIKIQAG